MRRRWTGGSIQKVKIAKRDKAVRQQEYFDKKKVDYGSTIPKRINDTVFQTFSAPTKEKDVQDSSNLEKSDAYLSKDYLLLTSRATKEKVNKSEDAIKQDVASEQGREEPHLLPDLQPVQMPTTLASDLGVVPRIAEMFDKVLFIDEGHDRTQEVYRALHAERLLRARGDSAKQRDTYELYGETEDAQLVDAALLMREQ